MVPPKEHKKPIDSGKSFKIGILAWSKSTSLKPDYFCTFAIVPTNGIKRIPNGSRQSKGFKPPEIEGFKRIEFDAVKIHLVRMLSHCFPIMADYELLPFAAMCILIALRHSGIGVIR